MKKFATLIGLLWFAAGLYAQSPQTYASSEILLKLKKLKVYGSVLYIAAHPDDENTRLLAYMANGKLYKTGYLSLTRGDGGQNLIGNEQGTELGLIRTNELLAARRIDGAEQFFSRAYDFGFSKSTDEALAKWNRDLILSDVVWVIRNFRPDVIITRFPEDSRAGHGHHSASAVLAHEAFTAAADPAKYPEQLKGAVKPWQAKRLLWNTYNFGSVNTQANDQFKIDVGGYNALLGKSYGEIAAESRSQHKSQGFGVPAQRGNAFEYFILTEGTAPQNDLLDGVETTVQRLGKTSSLLPKVEKSIDSLLQNFSAEHPEKSVKALVALYQLLQTQETFDEPWRLQKLNELHHLIELCSGLYFEATTMVPHVAAGDSLRINVNIVNRSGIKLQSASVNLFDIPIPSPLPNNEPVNFSKQVFVLVNTLPSQPYWLEKGLIEGRFDVSNQALIGKPLSEPPYRINLNVEVENQFFTFSKPVQYKHTDPVNGEIFQPLSVTPALTLMESPKFVFTHLNKEKPAPIKMNITALSTFTKEKAGFYQYEYDSKGSLVQNEARADDTLTLLKNASRLNYLNTEEILKKTKEKDLRFMVELRRSAYKERYQSYTIRKIEYPHIPSITYFYLNKVKLIDQPIVTVGKKIGFIPGAGDMIPEALADLNYEVIVLTEKDIMSGNLKQFDAIVTGVRAYNIHDWLNAAYDALMQYVYEGGNLLVQYNTSNYIGPVKSKIGPYPFEVSRARVTDENAAVKFLDATDRIFKWPNKISNNDFKDWVQERGIYFAETPAENYKALLGMSDAGEAEQTGSLITTDYGKGRFIYTGLVFFRQLPAGVGGAYRLFANLVANPKYQNQDGKSKSR